MGCTVSTRQPPRRPPSILVRPSPSWDEPPHPSVFPAATAPPSIAQAPPGPPLQSLSSLDTASITLVPWPGGRDHFTIDFCVDCTVDCEVTVYFAVREHLTAGEVLFTPLIREPCQLPPVSIPATEAASYQAHVGPEKVAAHVVDLSLWDPPPLPPPVGASPSTFPLVIATAYALPPPSCGRNVHYAYFALEPRPTGYGARLLQQRLQTAVGLFDLQAVFGGGRNTEDDACVVCLSRPCHVILLPCRHLCLCADCALDLNCTAQPRCPMCRAFVDSTVSKS